MLRLGLGLGGECGLVQVCCSLRCITSRSDVALQYAATVQVVVGQAVLVHLVGVHLAGVHLAGGSDLAAAAEQSSCSTVCLSQPYCPARACRVAHFRVVSVGQGVRVGRAGGLSLDFARQKSAACFVRTQALC